MSAKPGAIKLLYILAEMEDFWSSRLPLAVTSAEKGCEIHIAAPNAAAEDRLKNFGFCGHDLPPSYKGFSLQGGIKNILAIRALLRDLKPDIVHVITLKYSFLTGLGLPKKNAPRVIFTIAGLGYLFSDEGRKPEFMRFLLSPFLKKSLRHPAAHLTVQNADDGAILLRNGFTEPGKCTLIHGSGVDLEKFQPRVSGNEQTNEVPLILMPTRLVRNKGIRVFVAMAKILRERGIEARFQLAGGITDHNPLAFTGEEINSLVKNSPVEWLGKVTDMPALYSRATLIVYPSWYREGIPRVLLEAAAMGKAIVTTDHPGCRDAVIHNGNGLLVPIKDASATADAVEKLLRDPPLRRQMELRSRERAEREFDIRLITRQILAIYGF